MYKWLSVRRKGRQSIPRLLELPNKTSAVGHHGVLAAVPRRPCHRNHSESQPIASDWKIMLENTMIRKKIVSLGKQVHETCRG